VLQGKIAIVTGAGRGIGRGIATVFAGYGASVVVATRTISHGEDTVSRIRKAGGEALLLPTELQSEAEIGRIVQETVRSYGGLDIVVHNAALAQIQPAEELSEAYLDGAFALNVKAGVWLTKAAIGPMRARGGGRVLFTSSVTAGKAFRGASAYSISKSGLHGFIRTAALELAPYGITVNGVEPGMIETEALAKHNISERRMRAILNCIPLGRMGSPEDVAEAMAYLASDGAAYVTGQTIVVDGGVTLPENGAFLLDDELLA
jgi:3-oxoacyl-[acyl-carrier protein] reductase